MCFYFISKLFFNIKDKNAKFLTYKVRNIDEGNEMSRDTTRFLTYKVRNIDEGNELSRDTTKRGVTSSIISVDSTTLAHNIFA
jgi:hypothetical protein